MTDINQSQLDDASTDNTPAQDPTPDSPATAAPDGGDQPKPKRRRRSRAELEAARASDATVQVNVSPISGDAIVKMNTAAADAAFNDEATTSDAIAAALAGPLSHKNDTLYCLSASTYKETRKAAARAYARLTAKAKTVAAAWPSNPKAFFDGISRLLNDLEDETNARNVDGLIARDLIVSLMPKATQPAVESMS